MKRARVPAHNPSLDSAARSPHRTMTFMSSAEEAILGGEHTLLLDKSTFQALSSDEHTEVSAAYWLNVAPILAVEILADLAKPGSVGSDTKTKVGVLARKFGGSGGQVNIDWNILCAANLGGVRVEMDGRSVVDAKVVSLPDGTRGVLLEPGEFNLAFMRWAEGRFTPGEVEFAARWRTEIPRMGVDALWRKLQRRHIVVPRPTSPTDVIVVADELLGQPSLQGDLIEYLLEQLRPQPSALNVIRQRMKTTSGRYLKQFAPYAYHCLRAQLAVLVATRHKLVKLNASNMLDAQYLYYLPFCHEFVSHDRLHMLLAPHLVADYQCFSDGPAFKARLARLVLIRAQSRSRNGDAARVDVPEPI